MEIPSAITTLYPATIQLHLSGSRYFGCDTANSDWDIYTKWSEEVEKHTAGVMTKSNTYPLDDNTKAIYHKEIDGKMYNVILVKNVNKRKALDELVKKTQHNFFKSHKEFHGKLSLKSTINFLYKLIEAQPDESIQWPGGYEQDLPF